jgi:DNA topoisomerase-1
MVLNLNMKYLLKKALVSKLKALAKSRHGLVSDEDREGEAISHLAEELKLDKTKTKRIVFHEITKTAILKAIDNPRDYNLVNAQQARRV